MSVQDRGKLIQNFISVQEKMADIGYESYGSLYFVEDLDNVVIDWQSTEIAPLFEFARQPGFLNHGGPTAEGLERPRKPADFEVLDPRARLTARKL